MTKIVWIVRCDRPEVTLFLDELLKIERRITAMLDTLPVGQEVSVFDEVLVEPVGQTCLRLDIDRVMSCDKSE